MNNKTKIYELLEEAENYREKLKPKAESKSRLTPEEHQANQEAMLKVINKLLHYDERKDNVKRK